MEEPLSQKAVSLPPPVRYTLSCPLPPSPTSMSVGRLVGTSCDGLIGPLPHLIARPGEHHLGLALLTQVLRLVQQLHQRYLLLLLAALVLSLDALVLLTPPRILRPHLLEVPPPLAAAVVIALATQPQVSAGHVHDRWGRVEADGTLTPISLWLGRCRGLLLMLRLGEGCCCGRGALELLDEDAWCCWMLIWASLRLVSSSSLASSSFFRCSSASRDDTPKLSPTPPPPAAEAPWLPS
mmetsp:Transcript_18529/g.52929  ORF Transcript_18529/g.52929 Transcript_18529/m.52929 type:complete len:238 (+) Transcript_18529:435-1148(+)